MIAAGRFAVGLLAVAAMAGCAGSGSTSLPARSTTSGGTTSPSNTSSPSSTAADDPSDQVAGPRVVIDTSTAGAEISPLILGVSGDLDEAGLREAGIRLDSWGGNPSTRYNYDAGNLWNAARDWEYRNTNYGQDRDSFRSFVTLNQAAGVETRLAVPALGWVAKDATSCSFPDDAGGCRPNLEYDCEHPGPIADPLTSSVESTSAQVVSWIESLQDEGHEIRFIAIDNEPELWGATHYDVHPSCPTYEEILATYLEYASAIRAVAPDSELMGPVACCWFDYWRTAPGPADGSGEEYLPWFLRNVREHDEAKMERTLDVLDVHFYPQSQVYNDDVDPETQARRIRSVRALWDPAYNDESWITEPIAFIPRMHRIIEENYPGTRLGITEWNFGADGDISGAVAIADALGVFGREGVYAAAYWRSPVRGSPGFQAFRMHGNYDGEGTRFGGAVVKATSEERAVGAYAAWDASADVLRVMLINRDLESARTVSIELPGATADARAGRWSYGEGDTEIVAGEADVSAPVDLDPASITVLELVLEGP